ncbi:ankyrin repeat domain-containing protein [Bodo saltans virus]|uniref:Ankyrin repeat domain-containing protein n=1 Tax=Bodo saltans virus TaxID=2024608 RepID=A0A2H4UV88_9VIRU|nr:ankyrin repeat domain-containing protein [Bodo saltans virus]ATZ80777.1 ankyrin repeat domain-containing protein [Bodo saltans virus]
MKFIELINNNLWDEAITKLNKNIFENILGKKNIFHFACIRGNKNIINKCKQSNSQDIYKSDENGNTGAHLLAINGWFDLLYDLCINDDKFLILKNNNDKIILNFLYTNTKELCKFFALYTTNKTLFNDCINYVRYDNKTFLLDLIDIIDDNDSYDKNEIFKLILNNNFNYSIPETNLPFNYIINSNKINLAKYILQNKKDFDVNIHSGYDYSPLNIAIAKHENELIKLLIDHGADVNYGSPENLAIPLTTLIYNKNYQGLQILLKSTDLDFNKKNNLLNTPIYYLIDNIIMDKEKYNMKNSELKQLFFLFVEKSDLSNKNIQNTTPLHLIVKYGLWKDVKDILVNKSIDITILNTDNKTTLSYLNDTELRGFIPLLNNAKHTEQVPINTQLQINLPTTTKTNFGLFNADTIHNTMYLIYILNNYKNVSIPIQYPINDKIIYEKNFIWNFHPITGLIEATISMYTEFFYSILPWIIFWKDKNMHYISNDLQFYIKRALNDNNIRFILLKMSLIPQIGVLHANIIIFDKKLNKLIRFEPYGDWELIDMTHFDNMICKMFMKATKSNTIKMIRPTTFLKDNKFQTASNGDNEKNLGDPHGYCLAWCYWFLELKLKNPDIGETELVNNALENIIIKYNKNNDNPLLSYIREYAKKLDDEKNKIFKDIGFLDTEIYELKYTDEKLKKIGDYVHHYFVKKIN